MPSDEWWAQRSCRNCLCPWLKVLSLPRKAYMMRVNFQRVLNNKAVANKSIRFFPKLAIPTTAAPAVN